MSRRTPQFIRWLEEFERICKDNNMDDWDTDMFINTEGDNLARLKSMNLTPQEAYDKLNRKVE